MRSLVLEDRVYEALSTSALYEGEYARLLLQHADALFPGLLAVEFKPVVAWEGIGKRPDLALIDPEYRRWWVVEVELAHHSLEGHVAPQVEVLARAHYGDAEAGVLVARNAGLSSDRLRAMMRGAQPQVIVVVNAARPGWASRLRPDADVMVVEPFRSDHGRFAFRQDGGPLEVESSVLTTCRVDSRMPRLLIVESPAALAHLGLDSFAIENDGTVSRWRQVVTKDSVWLAPERGSPFPAGASVALRRSITGRMSFQQREGS